MERTLQAGRGAPYRQVLAEGLVRVAGIEGLIIPPGREGALGIRSRHGRRSPRSRVRWPSCGDGAGDSGVLSNTDADLLDASLARIGVAVDLRVVASEIGSYKPASGHWETFLRLTGADPTRHVHVGASLFHDAEPSARMGMPFVWIDREAETPDVMVTARLTDLTALPDTLDGLVPA